jgi:hypothetical protein
METVIENGEIFTLTPVEIVGAELVSKSTKDLDVS